MNFVAFIPARGGSKRLPGKNSKSFCGRPLIEHTLEFAIKSNLFSKIVVSSDSNELLDFASKWNVNSIKRPDQLSDDIATTADAAKHTAETLVNENIPYDALVTLQITNPFRTIEMLRNGIRLFSENECDAVISVSENTRKLGKIENDQFSPILYKAGQRSQDIDQLYYENGLFYISKKETILAGDIFGQKTMACIVPELFSLVDIDTKEDFELGELLFNSYKHLLDF